MYYALFEIASTSNRIVKIRRERTLPRPCSLGYGSARSGKREGDIPCGMVCSHEVGLVVRGGNGHIDTLTDGEIVRGCGQGADTVSVLPGVYVIGFLCYGGILEV